MKKAKYEVYENNGGGLFLAILDEAGNCIRIFENWEFCSTPGILNDAIEQLKKDPTAYEGWDGDLMERLRLFEGQNYSIPSIKEVYAALGSLIADSNSIYTERMGANAKTAFAVEDDEGDGQ